MQKDMQPLSITSISGTPSHGLPKSPTALKVGSKRSANRWEHRFSVESLSQGPSHLKESAKLLDPSRIIPLGNGRPAPEYYPWDSMTMCGTSETARLEVPNPDSPMTCSRGESAFDLSALLSYGHSAGAPEVVQYFTEHVKLIHDPPYQDWETCLTCGSTSAIERVFRMFCNRGDWILTEHYTYSGTVSAAKAQGLKILGVKMDEDGLDPQDLDEKLRNWDMSRGPKPFVLYTIPSGQNPTGITQSTERKKAIYQVAEHHDLYIIEDDPYYFLSLGDGVHDSSTENDYRKRLPVSYLSLDISGRVLRLDSASKILAPGLRFGWVTGSSQVIDMFINHAEVSTLSPSGPSQVMVHKLLSENWGHEGFTKWLAYLSSQYRRRRDILIGACEKHLPSHICQWNVPEVGMFLWFKLNSAEHPALRSQTGSQEGIRRDIEVRIHQNAEDDGVAIAAGSWFAVGEDTGELCLRVTFAAAAESDLEEAIRRFSRVVTAEFEIERE
ncbi:hypothetical protein QQX98_006336 [Neonectria punicea]|uniref:Aminotransferase class I/classII large domain-containing protein n=1 Tax=Neonectria punicea TaxID=979145 RepID=A0ABR1H159_9HYPO